MNSFQRVIERAEAIKRRKRRQQVSMPRRALLDSVDCSRVTVRIHGQTLHLVRQTEVYANDLARKGWYRGIQIVEFRRFGKDYKRCAGPCGMIKLKSAFSPDDRSADGRHVYCRPCRAEMERQAWRQGKRKRRVKHGNQTS